VRIACDAASRVRLDVDPLIARVAARLRETGHWNPMIAAEEIATDAVDDVWHEESLADAYARALADVHEQYLAQAVRVTEAIEALEEEGREAWIARAISHQLAFQVAWDALDRLDLLTEFPPEALCATCGAELSGADEGRDAAASA
jgi:hypothetical protein